MLKEPSDIFGEADVCFVFVLLIFIDPCVLQVRSGHHFSRMCGSSEKHPPDSEFVSHSSFTGSPVDSVAHHCVSCLPAPGQEAVQVGHQFSISLES